MQVKPYTSASTVRFPSDATHTFIISIDETKLGDGFGITLRDRQSLRTWKCAVTPETIKSFAPDGVSIPLTTLRQCLMLAIEDVSIDSQSLIMQAWRFVREVVWGTSSLKLCPTNGQSSTLQLGVNASLGSIQSTMTYRFELQADQHGDSEMEYKPRFRSLIHELATTQTQTVSHVSKRCMAWSFKALWCGAVSFAMLCCVVAVWLLDALGFGYRCCDAVVKWVLPYWLKR